MLLTAADGRFRVSTAPTDGPAPIPVPALAAVAGIEPGSAAGPKPVFESQLHEDIAITLVDVNLRDAMDQPEIRVRFYPNGTSDDFTIVLEYSSQIRRISLDPITGFANVGTLR
jgi:hypothetical protein